MSIHPTAHSSLADATAFSTATSRHARPLGSLLLYVRSVKLGEEDGRRTAHGLVLLGVRGLCLMVRRGALLQRPVRSCRIWTHPIRSKSKGKGKRLTAERAVQAANK
jgi:hypothetical protein